MIKKEQVSEAIATCNTRPFSAKDICTFLCVSSSAQRKRVSEILQELCLDGRIVKKENGKYLLRHEDGEAVFQANKKGFGFLLMQDEDDLFVPANKTNGAFDGDKVAFCRVAGTKDEAEITRIVQRGRTTLVGVYDKSNGGRFVIPDNDRFISDVYVPPKKDMGAKNGQKVAVKINVFPSDNRNNPEGEIVAVLGMAGSVSTDLLSVACDAGIIDKFSDEVERRAGKVANALSAKDYVGRTDLRDQMIFTIDGADAKDLDDAVSISANPDGSFTLGVHIADVSHYVKPGDVVDEEAFKRGNSVYFPNMVFPMLPTALCNGVCSLTEGQDRLAFSCVMHVDVKGRVVDCDLFPSIICSKRRFTYNQVQGILDGDTALREQYAQELPSLLNMQRLANILYEKRNDKGNIDFATKEVDFVWDERGNVVDVLPCERMFSQQIIEEFMILANETVAEYAETCSLPFVYRVHEEPNQEKFATLQAVASGVGITVKKSQKIHSSILQNLLAKAQKTPYYHLINDVMLRTMQKAKYSVHNVGHFGLASNCYCHFTSPIRRYADLVVHRILKTAVVGKMTDKALVAYEEMASLAADQASLREKVADEAERKADDVCKCSYAKRVVGQAFTGLISGVTERGLYVELPNTVEGFISVDKLGASFVFDKDNYRLFSDAKQFRLGDQAKIIVSGIDERTFKIDFDLAE